MFDALKYNLQNNRRGVMKQATAWFLFGAIIVVFIFWGMTPRNSSLGQGGPAAIVNDTAISPATLSEAIERLRRDPRMQQLESLGPDAGRQILQQQALSQLVDRELIRQETERDRIWTPDSEVRDMITSIPQFQEEGRFKRERYMNYLAAVHKTPAEFETDIRNEQALRRTIRLFTASLRAPAMQVAKQKEISDLKANLDFASFSTDQLIQPESISASDTKAFLAKPESAVQIKDYYNAHKSEFAQEEKVKAQHILILAKSGDTEAENKALTKIKEIETKAKTEDFAKLASQYSEDPGSKTQGGLLNFFGRGKMVKEFEDVAFSSAPGTVSAPVKTQYGYHLIKVLEKKPATTRTLEESREEIAAQLIAKDRTRVALEQLQDALKKGDQTAVNAFVTEHKLKWEETGAFAVDAESVPKVGNNDEMAKLAFSLTPQKPLAPTLVRQGLKAYIARYKAAPAKAIASVKAKNSKNSKTDSALTQDGAHDEMNPEIMQEMLASRRSEDTIKLWVDGLRKEAHITTNGSLMSRQ